MTRKQAQAGTLFFLMVIGTGSYLAGGWKGVGWVLVVYGLIGLAGVYRDSTASGKRSA